MINYEKCIEIDVLKKIISPESLGNTGIDICDGCKYYQGFQGEDGYGCTVPEKYTCENRIEEWLDEPYSGWAEKKAVEKLTEVMCGRYCKWPKFCDDRKYLDEICDSCELAELLQEVVR